MRAFLNFASQLALGIVIVAAIAVASSGSLMGQGTGAMASETGARFALDTPSVIVGLAIGVLLPVLTSLSWTELPRRLIVWVLGNERNFYRAGMACVLMGVLLFY
jgi:hypothetical protein